MQVMAAKTPSISVPSRQNAQSVVRTEVEASLVSPKGSVHDYRVEPDHISTRTMPAMREDTKSVRTPSMQDSPPHDQQSSHEVAS